MKRIIKLTEQQLREASYDNTFNYLGGGDTSNYSGQSQIFATGKLGPEEEYGDPITTDKVSRSLSPQTYNRYGVGSQGYRKFQNTPDTNLLDIDIEDDEISQTTNEDTQKLSDDDNEIDNFYKKDELDTLGNGVENDNLTRIPEGVEYKINLLLSEIKRLNLTPKQQAIVLNKIVESFDVEKIPYSWKKTLMLKIKH